MTNKLQGNSENGISTKQQKALTALLSERTARDAAKVAGCSERTLYTWLGNPVFRAALKAAEAEVLEAVTRRLSAGQVLALDTLEKLIQSARHESTKLTACVSWLNMFMKYHEAQDVENRLTELEKAVKNGKK
jgi:hypothetical protein